MFGMIRTAVSKLWGVSTARWRAKRRHRHSVNKKYKLIKTARPIKLPRNRRKTTLWNLVGDPVRSRR